jgi:hypothetical protein
VRGTPLCIDEREEISRGIAAELSVRVIAAGLGRNQSVVSREITRNGGRRFYRANAAQERAELLVARPKVFKLAANVRLHDVVAAGLTCDWSPQQISARLVEDHPDEPEMRVSHETIYQTLYLQARGELRTELKLALRKGRTARVARGSTRPKRARIAGFPLLGVHTEHRIPGGQKRHRRRVDILELGVPVRMLPALHHLRVGLQPIPTTLEQLRDRPRPHRQPLPGQLISQLLRGLVRPPQRRLRIAAGDRLHQIL